MTPASSCFVFGLLMDEISCPFDIIHGIRKAFKAHDKPPTTGKPGSSASQAGMVPSKPHHSEDGGAVPADGASTGSLAHARRSSGGGGDFELGGGGREKDRVRALENKVWLPNSYVCISLCRMCVSRSVVCVYSLSHMRVSHLYCGMCVSHTTLDRVYLFLPYVCILFCRMCVSYFVCV